MPDQQKDQKETSVLDLVAQNADLQQRYAALEEERGKLAAEYAAIKSAWETEKREAGVHAVVSHLAQKGVPEVAARALVLQYGQELGLTYDRSETDREKMEKFLAEKAPQVFSSQRPNLTGQGQMPLERPQPKAWNPYLVEVKKAGL